jgi:hypothetical protein
MKRRHRLRGSPPQQHLIARSNQRRRTSSARAVAAAFGRRLVRPARHASTTSRPSRWGSGASRPDRRGRREHSRRSGGYLRRSTAHFSVRQRSPLRKSFMPSRRRSRCLVATVRSRLPRRSRSSQRRTGSASHSVPCAACSDSLTSLATVRRSNCLVPNARQSCCATGASGARCCELPVCTARAGGCSS